MCVLYGVLVCVCIGLDECPFIILHDIRYSYTLGEERIVIEESSAALCGAR